jgi:outer membrane murein-binding lipoprotein Lpp
MERTKALIRAGSIGCMLLTFTAGCYASDADRISQLERDVQELKARLANLEPPPGKTINPPKSVPAGKEWKVLANWRALKRGMSYDDVRGVLSEPERISGGSFTRWVYPNQGYVIFYSDKLDSWAEPRQ